MNSLTTRIKCLYKDKPRPKKVYKTLDEVYSDGYTLFDVTICLSAWENFQETTYVLRD